MVEPYKPPRTNNHPYNMETHSTTRLLDNQESQYIELNGQIQHIQHTINSWDQTSKKELATKLDRWKKQLDEKLKILIVSATHVEELGNS